MAKGNRTTSTPRRATAVKATQEAVKRLCSLEDEGFAEVGHLRHLSALMAAWAEDVGCPGKRWSDMEMQQIGMRIESLAEMVKRHPELCGRAWMDVRMGSLSLGQWLTRLTRAGDPRADHVAAFLVAARWQAGDAKT